MAVRLVSVLHFYPLFSCEQIPFVFAKHVMEMILSAVWLYIIMKLKMIDLMTKIILAKCTKVQLYQMSL